MTNENQTLSVKENTETKKLTLQEQKELRIKAGQIIDETCGNCQLILENRKKIGNKGAYNFCNRECQVGKELQEIGQQLLAQNRKHRKL